MLEDIKVEFGLRNQAKTLSTHVSWVNIVDLFIILA